MSIDPQRLVDTCIGMWNESDPEKRQCIVAGDGRAKTVLTFVQS